MAFILRKSVANGRKVDDRVHISPICDTTAQAVSQFPPVGVFRASFLPAERLRCVHFSSVCAAFTSLPMKRRNRCEKSVAQEEAKYPRGRSGAKRQTKKAGQDRPAFLYRNHLRAFPVTRRGEFELAPPGLTWRNYSSFASSSSSSSFLRRAMRANSRAAAPIRAAPNIHGISSSPVCGSFT